MRESPEATFGSRGDAAKADEPRMGERGVRERGVSPPAPEITDRGELTVEKEPLEDDDPDEERDQVGGPGQLELLG